MEDLKEVYNKDKKLFYDLLKYDCTVIPILDDSIIIQVSYNNEKNIIEYYLTKDIDEIGYKIDDFSFILNKNLCKIKNQIEKYVDEVKKYDLLTFEFYDNKLYLVSIIDNGKLYLSDLKDCTDKLNVSTIPTILDSKLDDEQQTSIMKLMNGQYGTKNFDIIINRTFNCNLKNLIGVMFNFYITENKIALYKLTNDDLVKNLEDTINNLKNKYSKEYDELKELYNTYIDLNDILNKTFDDINTIFINILKDPIKYNTIIEMSSKLPILNSSNLLDIDYDKRIKTLILRGGMPIKIAYEQYILYVINILKNKQKNDKFK